MASWGPWLGARLLPPAQTTPALTPPTLGNLGVAIAPAAPVIRVVVGVLAGAGSGDSVLGGLGAFLVANLGVVALIVVVASQFWSLHCSPVLFLSQFC